MKPFFRPYRLLLPRLVQRGVAFMQPRQFKPCPEAALGAADFNGAA